MHSAQIINRRSCNVRPLLTRVSLLQMRRYHCVDRCESVDTLTQSLPPYFYLDPLQPSFLAHARGVAQDEFTVYRIFLSPSRIELRFKTRARKQTL